MAEASDLPEFSLPDPSGFTAMYEPTELPPLAEDAFRVFSTALPNRGDRIAIGLHIPDAEAQLLLRDETWQQSYFRQWMGQPVASPLGAPVAHLRSDETELVPRASAPVARVNGPAARPAAKSTRKRPVRRRDAA